jgi:3-phenylpropionate/trans-cinnamate dioxygenase ferredoxin reductase subunit
MPDDAILIVGAGECGARAAGALREEGFAGPVTLIGA